MGEGGTQRGRKLEGKVKLAMGKAEKERERLVG